jgi:hypothetical protein
MPLLRAQSNPKVSFMDCLIYMRGLVYKEAGIRFPSSQSDVSITLRSMEPIAAIH